MSGRIRVAPADELAPGEVRVVPLAQGDLPRPPEGLVLVDDAGAVHAYLNQCQHLPIPLDAGSRVFLDETGRHFRCCTHGALYRITDGLCVGGPCKGKSLVALPFHIDEDGFVVLGPMELDDEDDDEFDFIELADDETAD